MQELITRTKIIKTLNSDSSNSVLDLFALPVFSKAGYELIDSYHDLENIIVTNYIQNIPGIEYPVFELDVSDSQRDVVLLDLQWMSARIHLNTYLKKEGQDRQLLNVQSLLSPKPYPYARLTQDNIALDSDTKIQVSVSNVGWGLLQGQDTIVITADLTSHYYVDKLSQGEKVANAITNTATQILSSNSNRTAFTIFNNSNATVYMDVVNTLSLSSFMVKIPVDSYYENVPGTATSAYYAIHDGVGSKSIQLREFT